jgi:membrane fusion protein, multidrug efflux system
MNKRCLASLCALALLAACTRPVAPEEPIRAVRIIAVGVQALDAKYEYAAEVRPRVESRLGFRVGGKIIRRQVEVGQRVKVGQLLGQLDPQDFLLAESAARAQAAAALSNRDLAVAEFQRYKGLKDQNFISGAELDRRDSAVKGAQAQLEQAQAQQAAQANQSKYTDLLADAAGVITAVEAEPGQVLGAGTPVVRIAQDGPRDVVFSVPEDRVGNIRPGLPVDVKVWASQARLSGRVREVASSADPQTRTFLVKVTLDSAAAPALGSTVYAVPQAPGHKGGAVIKLPSSALKQDGQTSAVWVLEEASMTVRQQAVVIASADGNQVVIASGLAPGDLVVSAGVHVLSPGQKVTRYQEKMPNMPVVPASKAVTAITSVAK